MWSMTMCEECKYARPETVRSIVAKARPDQVLRLLRDIRRAGGDGGVEENPA